MRARLGLFFPLALLGCQLRPWTPSVSVAFWAEDVPGSRETTVPSSYELAMRWQMAPASPWARYYKGTLISSVDPMGGHAELPYVPELEVIEEAQKAGAHIGRTGMPAGTMWMLDLRGAASCAFVHALTRSTNEPVAPIPTFNNWPANSSLVPAEETLAGLIAYPPRLPPPEVNAIANATPVFMLDSWRLAYRFDEVDDGVYDNRYMLTANDLPDVQTLQDQNITKVVYVVEDLDDAEVEEDDLYESFRAWQAAGITIFFVDLDFLQKTNLSNGFDWTARLIPERYWSRERWTLVDDPVFYSRARAGFGLSFGRPYISPGYRGWGRSSTGGGGSRGSSGGGSGG